MVNTPNSVKTVLDRVHNTTYKMYFLGLRNNKHSHIGQTQPILLCSPALYLRSGLLVKGHEQAIKDPQHPSFTIYLSSG